MAAALFTRQVLLMLFQLASCYAISSSTMEGLMDNQNDPHLLAISPEHYAQEENHFQRTVAVATGLDYTFTETFGSPSGESYYFQCAAGPLVQLNGRFGWWVDGLKGYCALEGDVLGPAGIWWSPEEEEFQSPVCSTGYTGGTITYGDVIGTISLNCTSPENSMTVGTGLGAGEGPTGTFSCPEGMLINGFGGTVGDKGMFEGSPFIETIYFRCEAMTTCREKKNAEFKFLRRNQKVTKTCGWLREQSKEKKAMICSSAGGRMSANTVCKNTCGSCYSLMY